VRLFRALPDGKGKARYFIEHLWGLLAAVSDGENVLNALARLSRTEAVARPLVTDQQEIVLPTGLLAAFDRPARPTTVAVESLLRSSSTTRSLFDVPPAWENDPDKQAIKDWLDGKPVNRQSLRRLRQGAARWLRAVYPPDALHAEGVARPHGVLRWRQTYLGVRPPILLEGVDEGEGILLRREVGHTAFRLSEYANATSNEAAALAQELVRDEQLLPFLFAAMEYQCRGLALLETQLGVRADELALAMYVLWLVVEGLPEERPAGLDVGFLTQVKTVYQQIAWWGQSLDGELGQSIRRLFEDFFRLRKNVYDGPRIARLVAERSLETLLTSLTQANPRQLDKDFLLAGHSLCEVLTEPQALTKRVLGQRARPTFECEDLSPSRQAFLEALLVAGEQGIPLSEVSEDAWGELREKRPGVYAAMRVLLPTSLSKKA